MGGSAEALDRFERQTALPMMVLALAIVPLLVIPLIVDLSPATETAFFACDWLIWGVFAIEYGIRLYLAPAKGTFMRSNIIDLVVVIVPFLRPLRVARSARFLRLLRATRAGVILLRVLKTVEVVLTRHNLHYTFLVVVAVTVGAGVIVAEFERGVPDSTIGTIPDGLWWAATTVTTVGYGDKFPVTAAGRAFAVILMLVGIGLVGFLAASLASFLIERVQEPEAAAAEVKLEDLAARLDRMEHTLDAIAERLDNQDR